MPSEKDGIMIILSSPSGAGKTSLVKEISSKIQEGKNITSWPLLNNLNQV